MPPASGFMPRPRGRPDVRAADSVRHSSASWLASSAISSGAVFRPTVGPSAAALPRQPLSLVISGKVLKVLLFDGEVAVSRRSGGLVGELERAIGMGNRFG